MFQRIFIAILALSATTHGVAFDGPLPTATIDINANGWTPKPTSSPIPPIRLLAQRADDAGLCGYVEGLGKYPLTCATGACRQNPALNWFGCCSGDDSSCPVATRCVGSAAVESCLGDALCSGDQYVMGCSESSAPFCVQMQTVAGSATLSHFVCAATETSVVVKGQAGNGDVGALGVASAVTMTRGVMKSAGDGGQDGGIASTAVAGSIGDGQNAGVGASPVATTSVSTAGGTKAVAGAAGGLIGVLAMLL